MNDSRWISVKERLPEIKEGDKIVNVLCTWKLNEMTTIVSELVFTNDPHSLYLHEDEGGL